MADAPDFIAPTSATRRWPWRTLLAVIVLTGLLAMQILVADRAALAADPQWRPRIAAVCRVLHCRIPPWREPTAFHLTSREVRPHPSVPGALLISASFRNDAAFAQPWPRLELSLANLDGESLGMRRFLPIEYLGSAPTTPLIAPGQSASVTLELLDPGKRAVAFAFEFR